MASTFTIPQIAEAAGVSTATVDRVLNNRPGVGQATVERVRNAMESLGAISPVRGRPRASQGFKFAFVLPAARRGFFDLVDRVIAQSAGDFRHKHIAELTHRIPAHDGNAFAAQLAKLTDFDGIALLAPDVPAVKLAVNELVRSGIHVVTLFSDVAGSLRETYIGADNKAAGRTAGLLIGRELSQTASPRCALLSPQTRYAFEIDRVVGFEQVLQERGAHIDLVRFSDMPETEDDTRRFVSQHLPAAASAASLHAVYSVGPGSFGLSRALTDLGYDTRLTVAIHDLLEVNRPLLMSHAVTYVLHQDVHYAVNTAAKVLRDLCEGVRGALSVSNPRVEILTPENLA
jgi:LacI family transcriptional regulator